MSRWRFRKSIKIIPGVRINIASGSVGISAGIKGARVGINSKNGAYSHFSIPGTGLYRRTYHKPASSDSLPLSSPEVVEQDHKIRSEETVMYKIRNFFNGIINRTAPKETEQQYSASTYDKYEAYCVNCKCKREMEDLLQITMQNGCPAIQGKCSVCQSPIFKAGIFKDTRKNSASGNPIGQGKVKEPYVFANLDWGISEDQIKLKLQERGYVFEGMMSDNILHFTGTIMNEEANIGACVDNSGKLVKVCIFLKIPSSKIFEAYYRLRSVLIKKYGEPFKTFEIFKHPYTEFTGKSEEAVSAGKAAIATFWGIEGEELNIEIKSDFKIILCYQGPGWEAWNEKREIENARDL